MTNRSLITTTAPVGRKNDDIVIRSCCNTGRLWRFAEETMEIKELHEVFHENII